jgi:MFS family permease
VTHYRPQWRNLSLLCFFVLITDLSFSGLTPLIVEYERSLHFDLTTAGWVATVEGGGYALGMLLVTVLSGSVVMTRSRIAIVFLVLTGAQFASSVVHGPWILSVCRGLSGIGAGAAYGVGMPAVASSDNPERGFALYFGASFASGLIALLVIPPILDRIGLKGFYLVYGCALLFSTLLVRGYPTAAPMLNASSSTTGDGIRTSHFQSWLLIVSLFVNFIFNGGLWVLAEHFGLEIKGTDAESLGALLAGTMLFGLVGTAVATVIAQRWSHLTCIAIGNAGMIVTVLIMMTWHTVVGLIIAMAFLNMAVTLLTPATLAALAVKGARGSQWGSLALQVGYSLGPAAVAVITARSGITGLVSISVASFVICVALAWLGLTNVGWGRLQAIRR